MVDGLPRRRALALFGAALLGGCATPGLTPPAGAVPVTTVAPPDGGAPSNSGLPRDGERALAALLEGNRRFVDGRPLRAHSIAEVPVHAGHQRPMAVVLCCSDSRVAPETLFDQGVGDLFAVRVIGHVLDAAVFASVQYAVTVLAVPLVLVLGHERCGAVRAAVDVVQARERRLPLPEHPKHLAWVVGQLEKPATAALRAGGSDVYEAAMRLNVARAADELRFPGVQTTCARYDLDDGRVRLLS